jgi:hypothetical protein
VEFGGVKIAKCLLYKHLALSRLPIPTPEERALMLAKARKLNAESRNLAFKDGC